MTCRRPVSHDGRRKTDSRCESPLRSAAVGRAAKLQRRARRHDAIDVLLFEIIDSFHAPTTRAADMRSITSAFPCFPCLTRSVTEVTSISVGRKSNFSEKRKSRITTVYGRSFFWFRLTSSLRDCLRACLRWWKKVDRKCLQIIRVADNATY